MKNLRVGHGFDVHPLVAGRKLIVGGVNVPFEKGLAGHSDGDVLLHAVMDALLGAAGLPDIGQQFPPGDDTYKDADSASLLASVVQMLKHVGVTEVINVDCIVFAEQPRFSPHIGAMRARIAEIIGVDSGQVSIKATTTEKLGSVGRGEGIAASAVCLVVRNE